MAVVNLEGYFFGFWFLLVLSLLNIVMHVDLLSRELVLEHSQSFLFICLNSCFELGDFLLQRVGIGATGLQFGFKILILV